jgi:hypothetical protein
MLFFFTNEHLSKDCLTSDTVKQSFITAMVGDTHQSVMTAYGVQQNMKATTMVMVMRNVRARARSTLLMSLLRRPSLPVTRSPGSCCFAAGNNKTGI